MDNENYEARRKRIIEYKPLGWIEEVYGKYNDGNNKIVSVNVSGTHPILDTGGWSTSDIDINFVIGDELFKDGNFVSSVANCIDDFNRRANRYGSRHLKTWLINEGGYNDTDKMMLNKRTSVISTGRTQNGFKGDYSNAKSVLLDFMKVTGMTLFGERYLEEATVDYLPRTEARGLAQVAYHVNMQKERETGEVVVPTDIRDAAKAVLKALLAHVIHKENGFEPLHRIQQDRYPHIKNYYGLLHETLKAYTKNFSGQEQAIMELSACIRERQRKTNFGEHTHPYLIGAFDFVQQISEELGVTSSRQFPYLFSLRNQKRIG
ncbi:MAG: hypothetical protein V1802_03300 [Candidatus Aenigmatarchaeota archaeon]